MKIIVTITNAHETIFLRFSCTQSYSLIIQALALRTAICQLIALKKNSLNLEGDSLFCLRGRGTV